MSTLPNETKIRPELIFALVGQAGVSIEKYNRVLTEHLETFGYKTVEIRVSDLLKNCINWTKDSDDGEGTRVLNRQKNGLEFRKALGDGAALARAAVIKIREERIKLTGNPDIIAPNTAYILNQLKHPDEVELLRKIYQSSFYLLAGHAPKLLRIKWLSERLRSDQCDARQAEELAKQIVSEDEKQEESLGQNTRDTYPLADYFSSFALEHSENSTRRFIDLLFGHPFHSPITHEYAMYQAHASSLRSSDESRQVGAVIVSLKNDLDPINNIDIISTGVNEVPRRGGGYYWTGDSPDGRDQAKKGYGGSNLADMIKIDVLADLLDRLKSENLINQEVKTPSRQMALELVKKIKGTQFSNISEFMRTVHAEMAALIDSARRGVAVNGHSMYVTTFPCHNCAKHIIAAGLKRVIYLEPYPKSRATELHEDEIYLDSVNGETIHGKIVFMPYTGVAPRQYQQLFSMSCRGERNGLKLRDWEAQKKSLFPTYIPEEAAARYLLIERKEIEKMPNEIYDWDKALICPA